MGKETLEDLLQQHSDATQAFISNPSGETDEAVARIESEIETHSGSSTNQDIADAYADDAAKISGSH